MAGLDIKRSHAALQAIEQAAQEKKDVPEFLSQIKELPSALRINGLLAVLAERKEMEALLHPWLTAPEAPIAWEQTTGALQERLTSRVVYRQATAEALSFSVWLKRWAEAIHAEPK
jgi:CRISPR/Cas system CMR-associated protein Cmr5 small subunit